MRKSRFSEDQIIGVLRKQEAGAGTKEVCRRHGISTTTFHKWKARYGGLEISEARRLKALEAENAKLKELVAEQMLDMTAMRELLAKADHPITELACSAAYGGASVHGRARLLPVPRLQAARGRTEDGAPAGAARRPSGAGTFARAGR